MINPANFHPRPANFLLDLVQPSSGQQACCFSEGESKSWLASSLYNFRFQPLCSRSSSNGGGIRLSLLCFAMAIWPAVLYAGRCEAFNRLTITSPLACSTDINQRQQLNKQANCSPRAPVKPMHRNDDYGSLKKEFPVIIGQHSCSQLFAATLHHCLSINAQLFSQSPD